jgi:hypothetical protein
MILVCLFKDMVFCDFCVACNTYRLRANMCRYYQLLTLPKLDDVLYVDAFFTTHL